MIRLSCCAIRQAEAIEKSRHVAIQRNRSVGGQLSQFLTVVGAKLGPNLLCSQAVLDLLPAKCLISQQRKGGRVV
jgi:hypothetical protein